MSTGKQKYKRLQVENVWVRTAFEIAALIFAIVCCCVLIISSYEENYSKAARKNTADSTLQLAHSVSGLIDYRSLYAGDEADSGYISERYSKLLNDCFNSDSTFYSGAIYLSKDGAGVLFSQSDRFLYDFSERDIDHDDGSAGVEAFRKGLSQAATGFENVVNTGDAYFAFVPAFNAGDDLPYAVVAVSSAYKGSLEYDSIVRSRLIIISVVSGILIIAYYLFSAFLSEQKRKIGEAVNSNE